MPHPIFDAVVYPLHRDDAREFHRVLYTTIAKLETVDLLYKSCAAGLPPLPDRTVDVVWHAALDNLVKAQRLRELGALLAAGIEYSSARKVFDRLAAIPDPIIDPGFASKRIFVDRGKLRTSIGKLTPSSATASVLLVRGSAASGKSWTRHVVSEVAEALGQGCTYLCADLIGTPKQALDLIFAELGGKPPAPLSTENAWFGECCAQMIPLAAARQKGSWIVADDLGSGPNGPLLDPLILQLFEQIALQMINPAFARWFRLVLIDYPEKKVPTKWKGFWVEDRPTEDCVKAEVVADYVRRWAPRNDKVVSDVEADRLAREVLAKADTVEDGDERPRLERIHDELRERPGNVVRRS